MLVENCIDEVLIRVSLIGISMRTDRNWHYSVGRWVMSLDQ